MGCGVVSGNVSALSGCHCGPYSSSINNRSSIGMIGCLNGKLVDVYLCGIGNVKPHRIASTAGGGAARHAWADDSC